MEMKREYLIALTILLVVAGTFLYFYLDKGNNNQMANPASEKCIENGGKLTSVEFEKGTDNYCEFDDGSICWEWDFYRGDCKKGDLKIETVVQGDGKVAGRGDTVSVDYTGKLESGTVFDTSVGRGPFSFTLGAKSVIDGWEFGVLGMKVGEKRVLTISPDLGYGSAENGPIPANSTLIFDVELLEIN
jgi:peptidylprolyl isomerase/FKBP-type peptidyl-prolyl cis-trans isomerase FkpA